MSDARMGSRRPWWGTSLALALVCFFLALSSSLAGAVVEIGKRANDSFFRIRNRHAGISPVIIVAIDDAALAEQGRWPWRRSQLAELIDIIAAGRPRTIGLDVLLSEASDAHEDGLLAASLARAGNVVLPAKITTSPAGSLWIEPLPIFSRAALAIGHVHASLDEDGVCRRLPQAEMSLDGRMPMMAELVAEGVQAQRGGAHRDTGMEVLQPREVTIDYRALASWGEPFRGTFPAISAASIFEGRRYDLRDKTVLIGFASSGLEDELLTPLRYGKPSPGIVIQANMVDTLLRSRVIRRASPLVQCALLLSICLLGSAVMRRQNSLRGGAWVILSVATTYAVGYVCFVRWGIHFELGPAWLGELLLVPLGQLQHILLLQGAIGKNLFNLQVQAEGLPLHIAGSLAPQLDSIATASVLTSNESKLELISRIDEQIAIVSAFQQVLLGSMRDGIAVFYEEGRLLFENTAWSHFVALSGWKPTEAWGELLKALSATSSAAAGRVSPDREEAGGTGKRSDSEILIAGRLWRISMAVLPSVASIDKPLCMVLAADLTPQMERDQARQQALQFITHELRTPLVSLLGFAELLQHFPEQAKEAGAADVIQQESERLIALTTMFLECLKLETSLPVVRPIETDIEEVIQQTSSIARSLCSASHRRLVITTPRGATRANLDPAMMTGALLNLVGNAVKYGTENTDIEMSVELENDAVAFGVHNQGAPIPEEEIPRLFTPQYRMTENTTGRTGWGIGLAFVKRVMDAHGGEVRVTSDGVETCFKLLLPVTSSLNGARP